MKQLGGYLVRSELGRGGMATVYLAEESLSRRTVALKVLHQQRGRADDARRRFISEMQILTTLEHPNIVRCYHCNDVEGQLMMALEYVRGKTLREVLDTSGRLPATEVCRIAIGVLAALDVAHTNEPPIIHRDLKPENILLGDDGVIKVADFGIAKMLGTELTTTAPTGTLQYMSPEQLDGLPVTASSDLYSLGIVLYEALTGHRPFQGRGLLELIRAHHTQQPPPFPPQIAQHTPPQLLELVFALLRKDPSHRPPNARAVHTQIGHILQRASQPVPPPPPMPQPMPPPSPSVPPGPPVMAHPASVSAPIDTMHLVEHFDRPRQRSGGSSPVLGMVVGGLILAGAGVFVAVTLLGRQGAEAAPAAAAAPAAVAPKASNESPAVAGKAARDPLPTKLASKPLPPPQRSPPEVQRAWLEARDPGGPVPVHPELERTDFTIKVMVRRDLHEAQMGARIIADTVVGGVRPKVQIIRRPRRGRHEHWVLVGRYATGSAASADKDDIRPILNQGALHIDLSQKCSVLGPIIDGVRECVP